MQVKQRLLINLVVAILLVAAILVMLVTTTRRVVTTVETSTIADAVITTAFERLALDIDYINSGNERARRQIDAKYRQIGDLLKTATEKFTDPEDQKTLAALSETSESVRAIFVSIVANREQVNPPDRPEALSLAVEERLISQMTMRIYETVRLGGKLQESSNAALILSLKQAGAGIVAILLFVGVVTVINLVTLNRAISRRMARLRHGASLIGEGRLDHKIEIGSSDEFADLAKTFNAMAEKLRGSYHELEQEVEVRGLAEEALRRSEERYRSLFATMLDGFCVVEVMFDPDTKPIDYRFLECNPAFTEQTGLCNVEGRFIRELVPAIEEHWFEIYGSVASTGAPVRFVNEAKALNRWYDVSAYRVGKPENRHVAVVFNDITARIRAEENLQKAYSELETRVQARTQELQALTETLEQRVAERTAELRAANETLRASRLAALNLMEDAVIDRKNLEEITASLRDSEERLKRTQEIAHLGGWEYDLAGNRLFCSDEVYRIFGFQPQEFEATHEAFLERLHPDDRTFFDVYADSIREGRDGYEVEMRIVRKSDDQVRVVLEKCEHFRDPSARIIRSVGMVHDITESKEAEESLRRANADLTNLNKELESFVYSASHDLRAPLRHISAFAELVTGRYAGRLDEKGRDYLQRISSSAARMTKTIDELLKLSRISRQDIRWETVDLSEMAAHIVGRLREADPGRQVEVIIEPGLVAHGDPGLLELSLSNMLRNAWKYTSRTEYPHITFGTVLQNDKRVYYVRDNGVGFDMKIAAKMFRPFHRLHPDSHFEGNGIGLAIVERAIRRHGGRVWAEGEVGKGATLYFQLEG